jgi:hypothetical protein
VETNEFPEQQGTAVTGGSPDPSAALAQGRETVAASAAQRSADVGPGLPDGWADDAAPEPETRVTTAPDRTLAPSQHRQARSDGGATFGDDSALLSSEARTGQGGPEVGAAEPEPVSSERSVPVPEAVPIVSNTHGGIGLDFRRSGVRDMGVTAAPEVWTTYVQGPIGPEGTRTFLPERPPWFSPVVSTQMPYLVMADTAYGGVLVRTAAGNAAMSPAEFVDHLASFPQVWGLPADVPVVLLASRGGAGGLELPRLVAARTGRTVWSYSGVLRLMPSPDGTATWISAVGGGEGVSAGRWLRSLPDDLGAVSAEDRARVEPPPAAQLTTLDDRSIAGSEVIHQTIQDEQHRPLGRASLAPRTWAQAWFGERARQLGVRDYFAVSDDVNGEKVLRPGSLKRLPWRRDLPGATPYFFMSHGSMGQMILHTTGGDLEVDGTNLGRFLKRRPSLSGRSSQDPIVLAVCSVGAEVEQPGPSAAQLVADETGRVVYAPTAPVVTALHLMPSNPGDDAEWLTFRPRRPDTDGPTPVVAADGPGTAAPVAQGMADAAPVAQSSDGGIGDSATESHQEARADSQDAGLLEVVVEDRPVATEAVRAGDDESSAAHPPADVPRHVVRFAEHVKALSADQRRDLRRFAQETARVALEDHRAGLPWPRVRVRVEAGGNGGALPLPGRADAALRTSLRRGEAVVAELRQVVREVLEELQRGSGAPAVMDDSHFSVVPLGREAGRDVAQAAGETREGLRRQAVVTVVRSGRQADTLGLTLREEPFLLASVPRTGQGMSGVPAAVPEPVSSERSVPVPDPVPIVSRRNTRGDIGLDFRPDGVRRMDVTAPPEVWTTYVPGPAGPEGTRTFRLEQPPWFSLSVSAPVPYFVVADTTTRSVLVRTATGGAAMRWAEFADHLASLPQVRALPADVPVVLLVSLGGVGGLELPRLVAARTGRTVWSYTGELELLLSPNGTATRISAVGGGEGESSGRWLRSLPDDLDTVSAEERARAVPPRAVQLTTLDGRRIVSRDVVHHTIQDEQHRPLGRASVAPKKWAEAALGTVIRQLGAIRTYRVWDEVGDDEFVDRPGSQALPWTRDLPGVTPYFFLAHGNAGSVDLRTEAGVAEVDGTNLGSFLKRRPSLRRLPAQVPIVLIACSTGGEATEPGRNVAQLLADKTGRVVYAPSTRVEIRLDLYPSSPHDAIEWRAFHPRPPVTAGPAPAPPQRPEERPSHRRPRTGTRHGSASRHRGHDDRHRGER